MKSFAEKLIIPLFLTVLLTSVTAEAGVAGHGAAAREAESGPGVNMTQAAEETSAAAEETEAAQETAAAAETEAAQETAAAAETEAAQETTAAAETEAAAQSSAAEGSLTMIAAGDNLVHEYVYKNAWNAETGTYDFIPMYECIRDLIRSRDLAVVNQETIFVSDNSLLSTFPAFGTPQSMGEAIVDTGFDVVLSATNHTWDKGLRGVSDTLTYWKTCHPEIRLLGIHESPEAFSTIDYVEKNGIRLAMFNYTYGLNGFSLPAGQPYLVNLLAYKDKFLQDVRTAESQADMTVCFLHIGEEYHYAPTAFQRAYVTELVDAGADLVICAHPHVVEPVEELTTAAGNHALVYWSLGNFLASQTRTDTILGGLADVKITKDAAGTRVTSYDFIPTVIHFSGPIERVMPLDTYTDELAAVHHVNLTQPGLTVAKLRALWHSITGR